MPAILGLGLTLLAGCAEEGAPGPLAPGGGLPAVDFGARGPVPRTGAYGLLGRAPRRGAEVFAGAPSAVASSAGGRDAARAGGEAAASNGFQLNFDDADVGAVAKAVLGDILKADFLLDRRVTGRITLTSTQPVARARLVPLLESALAPLGAVVVRDGPLYRIVPAADPGGLGPLATHGVGEGFGTSVITARFMPAATLGHLLEGLGSRPGSVRGDAATNLVIVQGTASERRAAIDAAAMVDVDWLRTKSVAILPVANAAPETVIEALNRILDSREGGMARDAVQLRPMSRVNAILAVARRREGIDLVRTWVARLDASAAAAGGVTIYRLRFAQAKAVAATLKSLFGSGGAPGREEPAGGGLPAQGGGLAGQQEGGGPPPGRQGAEAPQAASGAVKPDGPSASAKALAAMGDAETPHEDGGGGPVRITADPVGNALLIKAGAADSRRVERAIRQIDRQPVQVSIEVTVAEVTLTEQLQYGVQFFLQGKTSLGLGGVTSLPMQSLNTAGLNLLAGGLSDPRVLLSALRSYTKVKILSSPALVVLDRQPAVLEVGDQVPIITRTAQSVDAGSTAPVVNTVDYKDTGIILNVLPKVNANGIVTLDIEQQISAVASTDPASLTPTISQRRVRSSVAVANGRTVMLGGLISASRSSDRSGFPGLVNLKVLNDILATHDNAAHRTEIIIFVRPRIIASGADAEEAGEEFRDRLQAMRTTRGRSLPRED